MKPRSAPRRRGPFLVTCGVALWLVASGLCIKALVDFDTTPGVAAAAPTSWPAGVALPRSAGRPTLVLFLHPRCSCSRATLAELERVLTRCPHRAAVDVVFSIPRGVSADSSRNPLWNQARRIPGVRIVTDPHDVMARRFASHTSGQAFLYDADGHLRFCGGLTGARGHTGKNAGCDAVIAQLTGEGTGQSGPARANVYGCALDEPPRAGVRGSAAACPRTGS